MHLRCPTQRRPSKASPRKVPASRVRRRRVSPNPQKSRLTVVARMEVSPLCSGSSFQMSAEAEPSTTPAVPAECATTSPMPMSSPWPHDALAPARALVPAQRFEPTRRSALDKRCSEPGVSSGKLCWVVPGVVFSCDLTTGGDHHTSRTVPLSNNLNKLRATVRNATRPCSPPTSSTHLQFQSFD